MLTQFCWTQGEAENCGTCGYLQIRNVFNYQISLEMLVRDNIGLDTLKSDIGMARYIAQSDISECADSGCPAMALFNITFVTLMLTSSLHFV
jgi:hypothetical protein